MLREDELVITAKMVHIPLFTSFLTGIRRLCKYSKSQLILDFAGKFYFRFSLSVSMRVLLGNRVTVSPCL